MTLSSVGGLNATRAEQMYMSIRLKSDGLTFAVGYGTEPIGMATLPLAGYGDLGEAVREQFFTHPELSFPYREVIVYFEPMYSVLVPRELYDPQSSDMWCGALSEDTSGIESIGYPLPDESKVIVSAWSADLYQFLHRTHLRLRMIPYYVSLIERRKIITRQLQGAELCVSLRRDGADCFVLRAGELVFLNNFSWVNAHSQEDMLGELKFYTFSLWHSIALSADADSLLLAYPIGDQMLQEVAQGALVELSTRIARTEELAHTWSGIIS